MIRVWEEAPPVLVIEVSNADCRADDRGRKLEIYRDVLRVPEYLIYDADSEELLKEIAGELGDRALDGGTLLRGVGRS